MLLRKGLDGWLESRTDTQKNNDGTTTEPVNTSRSKTPDTTGEYRKRVADKTAINSDGNLLLQVITGYSER